MKRLHHRRRHLTKLALFALLLTGCTGSMTTLDYQRAEFAVQQKDYRSAVSSFQRVIKRNPTTNIALDSARKAATISLFQIEDFQKAVEFYQYIATFSKDQIERRTAQRNVANIYYDKLANYDQAVIELNRLLTFPLTKEDEKESRFALAKSYYYLKNFYQARTETEILLKKNLSDKDQFQAKFLLGNIDLASKNAEKALATFTDIKKQFPELAKDEKIDITIAVCYEEMNDFNKAIEVLKTFKSQYSQPEFIDLKIRRLEERAQNLPGATGFRK